ncbi:MAG: exodeoxyribonuclease V subunit beta [Magnetococcales bacterium]|nr:exodeoxyribonuclease V subunit beta [Magnetococcales bacterium]
MAEGMLPVELDPLRFALRGRHLIEASAGTGKTYTIALLYVRLVLGHGEAREGVVRPLTPPEILVVTFTKAATRELRDRIRVRLSEAAACFRADAGDATGDKAGERPGEKSGDKALLALRGEYPSDSWPGCARKLQLAAEWMDEASVETIHGWCNRMLREHAFDSDSLFTQQLEADQGELLAEVVRDYWRVFLAPLTLEPAREAYACWPHVGVLQEKVRRLLRHTEGINDGQTDPPAAILEEGLVIKRRLAAMKPDWRIWVPELRGLLDRAVAAKQVDGRKIQARYYGPWLNALEQWAQDPAPSLLVLSDTAWQRLTQDGLAEAWKRDAPPEHPALRALMVIRREQAGLARNGHRLLGHAAGWIAERFAAEKAGRALMEFDDVLQRLDAGLRGPNGARLAGIIRQQFPVALIDEFQDTDPLQYRIFDTVYPDHTGEGDGTALILIGDPKQAIYSFRGADIHTYLLARRLPPARIHTLKTNHRATTAMVAAVNRLFSSAEGRGGAGAFLQRGSDGANPIPFVAVEAQGRGDVFMVDQEIPPAMTVWWSEDSLAAMAEACAGEMVRLLTLGQSGRAGFAGPDALWRPVAPSDMAVLVNGRKEFEAMRVALGARGVRCVYLSDKESVFQTPRAVELRHWLAACAAPEDPKRIRAALATGILGLGWDEIDALSRDEGLLDRRIRQFRVYQECWRRQGVLPMLRRLMHDFRVPERLLGEGWSGEADGERVLTDLLHLAELLQKNSAAREGEQALIRDLDQQIRDGERGAEEEGERLMRLESDADLVRVVTVHKSKGLEYPLVFFPFAASCRPVSSRDLPTVWRDAQGEARLAFDDPDGAVIGQLDRERLREDVRKLYVALTRARYATWVGIVVTGGSGGFDKSAIRHLLTSQEKLTIEELAPLLTALNHPGSPILAAPAPAPEPLRFQPVEQRQAIGGARRVRRVVREGWWIGSYSAINTPAGRIAGVEAPESPGEDLFRELGWGREEGQPDEEAVFAEMGGMRSWHAFPRGAKAGTFLHELLSWCALQGFARVVANPEGLREVVARRCQPRGWSGWSDVVTLWLLRIVSTPLDFSALTGEPDSLCRLMDLTTCQAEMEFLVAARRVRTGEIDRLVCAHTLRGAERPGVAEQVLHGMLKGFMDLVFEYRGRYFVLDYKSNHLGWEDRAYGGENLCAEMLQARYELQYVLYLFALHRHLQARLPDYDYDRHMGGAIHWFVRGLEAPGQGVFVDRPSRQLFEALDGLFDDLQPEEQP